MRGNAQGYARVTYLGDTTSAHRAAYCAAHGLALASITGRVVRHMCDNPRCVRPDHLLIGTTQDNADDKARRRRVKGTKLDADAVLFIREHCRPGRVQGQKTGDPLSYLGLAVKFGVSPATVRKVYLRKTHKFIGAQQ